MADEDRKDTQCFVVTLLGVFKEESYLVLLFDMIDFFFLGGYFGLVKPSTGQISNQQPRVSSKSQPDSQRFSQQHSPPPHKN
jgi:hypothetical protein